MRSRIVLVAGLTIAAALSLPSPAFADVPPAPAVAATLLIPLLLAGLAFVLVVSGISFVLLRRMARKRREEAGGAPAQGDAAAEGGALVDAVPVDVAPAGPPQGRDPNGEG